MKKITALVMFFMSIGAVDCFAEMAQKSTFELGIEISHITYEEPGVMEEKGFMSGLACSYAYRDNYMLKGEGKLSSGQVKYDGKLSDGTPYTVSGINDYMFEFRGLAGYDFPAFKSSTFTPYIGLGYRYLNDGLQKDVYGYERESNYCYSPIGIETITFLKNGWSAGLTFEYDIFWKGVQKSHLSDVNAGLSDIENDQNSGYGCRGAVKFQKKSRRINYSIALFIKYWNIKKSEETSITYNGDYIGYGYEPKNNSTEIGIKFATNF